MSRLRARADERIDRGQPVTFTFDGAPVTGFEGDTLGSALYADGRRVFSRSFKYHRPRGLVCCTGQCANCMATVDGRPNVRLCAAPIQEGAAVTGQNVLGSVDRDFLSAIDKFAGPFTPPGFYYKTFIRPRRLWPVYEKFLRNAAGLGKLDPHAERHGRFETEHRSVDLLVVGGGSDGLREAIEAAERGSRVALVDDGPEPGGTLLLTETGLEPARALAQKARDVGVEVLCPARAVGIYEGNLVPIEHGNVLIRMRAGEIAVATGTVEQPLVFPGNDLVGVMLPGAASRLVHFWSIKPGERAVVIAADDSGARAAETLQEAGVRIAAAVDLRTSTPHTIEASGKKGRVHGITIDGENHACDLVVASGSPQPAHALLSHAGARVDYDDRLGVFIPVEIPDGIRAIGSAAGEIGDPGVPRPSYGGEKSKGKEFVCICEDQTTKDLRYAHAEGYDSIELSKRYTTVTMGPCQGRLCHLNSVRMYAETSATDESRIGTTTARPPWSPVSLELLAGRPHEPARRTSMHHRHKELGASMMWTGEWRRPYAYGDPAAEVRAVHDSVGIIDVSTLGKILVTGSDAATFLERIYPNRFGDMASGRIRYGVLTSDAGRITDDGTIARLDDDVFYVTTTSTGAEAVVEWFEWWNAIWGYQIDIVNVTGTLAAINVAGPNARELMTRVTDIAIDAESFRYLDAKQGHVAGVASLLLRIGFVGELGYEIHFPSVQGEYLLDALIEAGADFDIAPFGLEPQRVLRLEKAHILAGQDTDSESNLLEASMPWILKLDKGDFVGRWSAEHVKDRGLETRLVGFRVATDHLPAEGGQIVEDRRPVGRITSARRSEIVGSTIGLAWVPADKAVEGADFDVRINGELVKAEVTLKPFYDPDGERLRS